MILGSEGKPAPVKEEPEQQPEEKKITGENKNSGDSPKGIGISDKESPKESLALGAELKSLEGKSAEDQPQETVKGETKPPEKLQPSLEADNLRWGMKHMEVKSKISDIEVINQDPMLKDYENDIRYRINTYKNWIKKFDDHEGGIIGFAGSYKKFGLNRVEGGIMYREWAPCAQKVALCGDFNNWNRSSHTCKRDQYGVWELFIQNLPDGSSPIKHGSKVKAALILADGKQADRNPAWIHYVVQDKKTVLYDGIYWDPPTPYKWKFEHPTEYPISHRIYECHVGMSSEEGKINTYRDFADWIIPRIKKNGYNVIQLMAIMEHVYYGSFGYHVTNFFAVCSRFGTPDDFKYLVDKAHENGMMVVIDCIHSHASNNVMDGINYFDGTDHQYFHSGPKGYHKLWDSRLFNFSHWEVLRFLLSDLRFYMDEYKIDGFRFDAVTCIMFTHHGIHMSFSGHYHEYFGGNADNEGIVFLMMANDLIHRLNPNAITIAEDVSGMPTLCRPVTEGGLGFDYRLNMSVPDKWIKLLKEVKDDDWNMGNITYTLTNRRYNEKCVAYVESHDQAIVGDKTISMWLFDKEIYDGMSLKKPPSLIIDRGMSLHKMLRLITFALGGDAYLNFMGNEFGHPEWIDFPRPGNGWSYHYCRRQWHLVDDPNLRYHQLNNFDIALMDLDKKYKLLVNQHQFITLAHESDKVIVFEKGDLLFIFNFHPTKVFFITLTNIKKSYEHYRVGTKWASDHRVVLNTDRWSFGGRDRIKEDMNFPYINDGWCNRPHSIKLYIPARSAIVLIALESLQKYMEKPGDAKSS